MNHTNLTGQLLIAMPNSHDSTFNHTVTYVCDHNEYGAMGLVINRETNVTLQSILDKTRNPNKNTASQIIYAGGPVHRNRGFILHKPAGSWNSSISVTHEITLTTSIDVLEAIAQDSGPEQTIIALGYAGWGPYQLESEFLANAWLSCPADDQIIFHTPTEERWDAAAKILGINLDLVSSESGHA